MKLYKTKLRRLPTFATTLVFIGAGLFAGPAAAGQLYVDGRETYDGGPLDAGSIPHFIAWIETAECTGSSEWVEDNGSEHVQFLVDQTAELGNEVMRPQGAAVAIAAIGLAWAVGWTIYNEVQEAEEKQSWMLKWDYACTVTNYGIEANGAGGLFRRVAIEVGTNAGYTEVGSCEYIGEPIQKQCDVPAQYSHPEPTAGNTESGVSRCCVWGDNGFPTLENPPPGGVNVCISPDVRAHNVPQHEALGTLPQFRDVSRLYGEETCKNNVCIIWADSGCKPPGF